MYQLKTPRGAIPIINLHLASPHNPFDELLDLSPSAPKRIADNSRMRWEQSQMIGSVAQGLGQQILVGGDFNTQADSAVFRESWNQLTDAFSAAGWGYGRTYFARLTATRIDHVLAGAAWRVQRCVVGPDIGSAHRPVLAELELQGGPGTR
jgi:endonuclease/exonuclease/phosphatase (EEP) superfamily protein YafD